MRRRSCVQQNLLIRDYASAHYTVPSEFLEEHAKELGVVKRDRDLQIPAFVWAFVFGFAAGESRTLAGFRRSCSIEDAVQRYDWISFG